jgi:hypothetical protein
MPLYRKWSLRQSPPKQSRKLKQSWAVSVSGYMNKYGKYFPPHSRSRPNRTPLDNWSTKPNINPFTGKRGTKGLLQVLRTKPKRISRRRSALARRLGKRYLYF